MFIYFNKKLNIECSFSQVNLHFVVFCLVHLWERNIIEPNKSQMLEWLMIESSEMRYDPLGFTVKVEHSFSVLPSICSSFERKEWENRLVV